MKNLILLFLLVLPIFAIAQEPSPVKQVFSIVEDMPRFKGCEHLPDKNKRKDCAKDQMATFISTNLRYPASAQESAIEGKVIVKFIVYNDGKLGNMQVVKTISEDCSKEALKVVQLMNEQKMWIPGKQRGKAVDVQYLLPISFSTEMNASAAAKKETPSKPKVEDDKIEPEVKEEIPIAAAPPQDPKVEENKPEPKVKAEIPIAPAPPVEAVDEVVVDRTEVVQKEEEPRVETERPPPPPPVAQVEEEEVVDRTEIVEEEEETRLEVVDPPPAPRREASTKEVEEEIFKVVEEMPRFPGCEGETEELERSNCAQKKMLEFMYKNIKYPPEARKNGTTGTAIVRFVVEKTGKIGDIQILRDPGDGLGDETKRVIETLNERGIKWIPGKQRGKKVPVYYVIPVKFNL